MNTAFESNTQMNIGKHIIACEPKNINISLLNTSVSVIRNKSTHQIIGIINIDLLKGKLWFNPSIEMMFDSECLKNISDHMNKFEVKLGHMTADISYKEVAS